MEEEASATTSQLRDPSTLHPSNSPSWSFFLQRLASKGEDPNSPEVAKKAALKENEYRHKSVQYIQHVGQRLRMCAGSSSSSRAPDQSLSFIASPRRPQLTIATAIVFYHRFYLNNSYEQYDRFVIANTCLFLAGKVEETPKKLKDVVIESYRRSIRSRTSRSRRTQRKLEEFWEIKEHVLVSERILLQSLGFDLSVEHPQACAPPSLNAAPLPPHYLHRPRPSVVPPPPPPPLPPPLAAPHPPSPACSASLAAPPFPPRPLFPSLSSPSSRRPRGPLLAYVKSIGRRARAGLNFTNDSLKSAVVVLGFAPRAIAAAAVSLAAQYVQQGESAAALRT